MNPKINKAIDIFNSEDPVSAILENRDFFPFIEKEMMGVAHPKVHCEGDVWDHTALVINNLRPGDCDLMMAAQCFVGMCMKKMVMSTPPTNMFDDFLTDEYRAHLSKLIGVDSWRLEGAIQIGAVRTNFYSLYDEGVRNGTEH